MVGWWLYFLVVVFEFGCWFWLLVVVLAGFGFDCWFLVAVMETKSSTTFPPDWYVVQITSIKLNGGNCIQ